MVGTLSIGTTGCDNKPKPNPTKEAGKEAVKETVKEAVKETTKETVKETVKDGAKDAVKETVKKDKDVKGRQVNKVPFSPCFPKIVKAGQTASVSDRLFLFRLPSKETRP